MRGAGTIKCVVWDLDNTLWEGVLLEDEQVRLDEGIAAVIRTLDARGILHSIASRNDRDAAIAALDRYGLLEYLLYPQINWGAKSSSIRTIAKSLNIGLDAIAFVDDEPFERQEVRFNIPEVLCLDPANSAEMPDLPELNPRFVTDESERRRLMYVSEIARARAEEAFAGTDEQFLASLDMVLTVAPAGEGDLQRAEELTLRTHQLNTTGRAYSYRELDRFRTSDRHRLLIADLTDKYGTYGKIGLVLLECGPTAWSIKLLLTSCRVMSRGVGTILINHVMGLAVENRVRLYAEYVPNGRNRMMYIAYTFAGFREIGQEHDLVLLENDLSRIQPFPDYMIVQTTP